MSVIFKPVEFQIKHIQCDLCLVVVEADPNTSTGTPAGWAEFLNEKIEAEHVCPKCSHERLAATVAEARRK